MIKLIHYSRCGYEGNYSYNSVCGKKVKTHQDKEESSIYPEEANCKKCLATKEYKTDILDTPAGIKVRIYIESDILHADEFRNAQREVKSFADSFNLQCVDRVFSKVIASAWHDLENTWKVVKSADEIYSTSSLMPLIGGSYMGAPVIFNGMCERAIKEKVEGKIVIVLNSLKNIHWDYIHIPTMKKAFKKNDLMMYNDDYDGFIKVDVSKIKQS